MSDDVRDLLEGAGKQLLEHMKARPEWEELDETVRDKLREAAFDLGKLTVLELAGHDVSDELAQVHAQIASWQFRASSQAQQVLSDALRELFGLLGALLRGFIRTGL